MKNTLIDRTMNYAVAVWRFCNDLPNGRGYNAYANQLIRCSSSVGANYRASQRAKSTADFIYKLKIVEEEADESLYFLELFSKINPALKNKTDILHKEGNEILSIIVASIITARKNQKKK